MSRRKLTEQNIRKLTKMGAGRSFGITLPISIIRDLKWRERQKLTVKKTGQKIVIQDWQKSI